MAQKEKADKSEKEVEEASINAYIDASPNGEETITEKEQKKFLWDQYKDVKTQYKSLKLSRDQAKRMKDEDALNRMTPIFRKNYELRKDSVVELRRMGEKVKDQFIPESMT